MTGISRIRIVDNDPDLLVTLEIALGAAGFITELCPSAEVALQGLDRDYAGVVLSDVRMPGMDGLALFAELRRIDPELPVILMSGHGDIDMAVGAMRDGAWDFLTKPVGLDPLLSALRRACEARHLVLENRALRRQAGRTGAEDLLIGESPAIVNLRRAAARIAEAGLDVLIEGPSGAGKEQLARAIHRRGPRRNRSFVHIACDALDEASFTQDYLGSEAESVVAGHAMRKPGRLDKAHGGVLFLDRVDLMPLALQGRMLRLIEAREYFAAGATSPRPLDVQLVASSAPGLAQMVAEGRFREDLLYRLSALRLEVPALGQRRQDVLPLYQHFLREAAQEHGVTLPPISAAVFARLEAHDWPGNLRELQTFARAQLLGGEIEADAEDAEGTGLHEALARHEKQMIREALMATGGNASKAMERLKISRKTFYDRMHKLGLKPRDFRMFR